jgi:tRNA U55 pseudouridine synthase TruB
VRTLVEDFGQALGTEGTVERLARTAVGSVTLEKAVDQESILAGELESVMERAMTMADALAQHRGLELTETWVRRVRQGAVPPWSVVEFEGPPPESDEVVRLLGPLGSLIAVARVQSVPGPPARHWADDRELILQRVL